jgi:hypothetical protein
VCWAGRANICLEYATKRYRSNLINWGSCPSPRTRARREGDLCLSRTPLRRGKRAEQVTATRLSDGQKVQLKLDSLDQVQRRILLDGCLMNYYASTAKEREFMSRIPMGPDRLEMDGDEMTRILWKMIKEELLPAIRRA